MIGFSPDGGKLAAWRDDRFVVWDTQSWNVIESGAKGRGIEFIRWDHAGALIAVSIDGYEEDAPSRLAVWSDEIWVELMDLTEALGAAPHFMLASEWGPQVILEAGEQVGVADYETGTVTVIGPWTDSFYRFVRDGQAVGAISIGGLGALFGRGTARLNLYDLSGAPLEPTARDWVVFDQILSNPSGSAFEYTTPRPFTYRATEVEPGSALVAAALEALDVSAKAEVAAKRVMFDGP